jgi:hypothetical protein
VPGMSGRLVARRHMGGATALVPVGARRHVPVSSAWLSPGASLGVFKDRPSIDMGSSRQLLRGSVGGGWPLRCPRFGPTLPGVESCSAFTVSHRPGGLLRVLSCGFVAPRCRSWGSSSFGPAGRLLSVPGGRAVLVDASALRSFSLVRSRPSFKGSCLPAVRLPGIRSVRLQGLAPRVKSAAAAGVATGCRSLLPWAFLPQAAKKGSPFRDLHRSLTAAVPWGLVLSHVPPFLGASCEVPGFRLRTLRSSTLAGKVVRLPLLVAEATGGERSSRFILVSIPSCSGCEHPLQVGKRKRGWPLSVAGGHDASGSKSR